MKTLAKDHACNHCVIDDKNTFKNILIGPGKLPGLSRKGPQGSKAEKSAFTGSGATLLSGFQVQRDFGTLLYGKHVGHQDSKDNELQ